MERNFEEYNKYRDKVRSDLERYETIFDYYLKFPKRIGGNEPKIIELFNDTEKLINSNSSGILGEFYERIEEKLKEVESLLGKILIDRGSEIESIK